MSCCGYCRFWIGFNCPTIAVIADGGTLMGLGRFPANPIVLFSVIMATCRFFSPTSQIWKSKVPPKVKFHVWSLALRKLNTCDHLQRKGLICAFLLTGMLYAKKGLITWWKLFSKIDACWVIPKGGYDFLSKACGSRQGEESQYSMGLSGVYGYVKYLGGG